VCVWVCLVWCFVCVVWLVWCLQTSFSKTVRTIPFFFSVPHTFPAAWSFLSLRVRQFLLPKVSIDQSDPNFKKSLLFLSSLEDAFFSFAFLASTLLPLLQISRQKNLDPLPFHHPSFVSSQRSRICFFPF